jgi:hypothetical protein
MPCHVPATSVSSHRRKPFSKSPSIIAAKLDMTRPGERWAQSFMVWAATGARPAWKPLAVARRKDALVVAVEWGTWPHDERPYGVVEIALSGDSLRWQSFQIGEKERMLKLVSGGESPTDWRCRLAIYCAITESRPDSREWNSRRRQDWRIQASSKSKKEDRLRRCRRSVSFARSRHCGHSYMPWARQRIAPDCALFSASLPLCL